MTIIQNTHYYQDFLTGIRTANKTKKLKERKRKKLSTGNYLHTLDRNTITHKRTLYNINSSNTICNIQ